MNVVHLLINTVTKHIRFKNYILLPCGATTPSYPNTYNYWLSENIGAQFCKSSRYYLFKHLIFEKLKLYYLKLCVSDFISIGSQLFKSDPKFIIYKLESF